MARDERPLSPGLTLFRGRHDTRRRAPRQARNGWDPVHDRLHAL